MITVIGWISIRNCQNYDVVQRVHISTVFHTVKVPTGRVDKIRPRAADTESVGLARGEPSLPTSCECGFLRKPVLETVCVTGFLPLINFLE